MKIKLKITKILQKTYFQKILHPNFKKYIFTIGTTSQKMVESWCAEPELQGAVLYFRDLAEGLRRSSQCAAQALDQRDPAACTNFHANKQAQVYMF
jgi:hypothetical protein